MMRPSECAPIMATISLAVMPKRPEKSAVMSGQRKEVDGSVALSPTQLASSTRPETKGSTSGVTEKLRGLLAAVLSAAYGVAASVEASSMASVAAST